MNFPNDTNKNSELNSFIKLILNKKVNHRVCSFSKLKASSFLNDFNWDDLMDFKIKPPYIPECEDYGNNLSSYTNPFDGVLRVKFFILF